jgi:hypothetical protein
VVTERGPEHAFPTLAGAWRLGIGVENGERFPWQVALVEATRDDSANGVNARIAAGRGRIELRVPVEGIPSGARVVVALVRDREEQGRRRLEVPRP